MHRISAKQKFTVERVLFMCCLLPPPPPPPTPRPLHHHNAPINVCLIFSLVFVKPSGVRENVHVASSAVHMMRSGGPPGSPTGCRLVYLSTTKPCPHPHLRPRLSLSPSDCHGAGPASCRFPPAAAAAVPVEAVELLSCCCPEARARADAAGSACHSAAVPGILLSPVRLSRPGRPTDCARAR